MKQDKLGEKETEITVLKAKGSKEDIKARQRAKNSPRNNLPGVNVQ